MSSKFAIVAIPRKDDRVWDVSSEKVPHLTILYLGEQELGLETIQMTKFVEHAANTSLRLFGLDVERRGTLGDEDADVLFFNKRYANQIASFRESLLSNRWIREAYNSVEQHPGWTPHLTLGYPATPAKKTDRADDQFYWVNFDKIAFWTDDYAGLEFDLKPYEESDLEVAMSEIKHHGVPGMKWGVRRSRAELARRRTEPSTDFKKSRELKKNPRKTLSNKEMKTIINRLSLEKQMGELDKSAVDKGHDKVKKYLAIATTVSTAYALSQSPMGKAVKARLGK